MDIQLIEQITDELSTSIFNEYCKELSSMTNRVNQSISESLGRNEMIDIIGSAIMSYLLNNITEMQNEFKKSMNNLQNNYAKIIHDYKNKN